MPKYEDKFPEGKLQSDDEGLLNIRMGIDPKSGKFILDFGGPVTWIGMSKEQAFHFAKSIMRHVVDQVVTIETPDGPGATPS